jgi:ankyrin repeat protein
MSSDKSELSKEEQQQLNEKLLVALKEYISGWNQREITELIKARADINAKDKEEKTPLMHAIEAKNYEGVKILIKAGADINAKDEEGKTPLMHAIEEQKYEILGDLIKAGADIGAKDHKGKTVFSYALDTKDRRLIKDFQDHDGKTLLMLASEARDKGIKELMDEGADIDAEDHKGKTALSYVLESVDDMSLAIAALDKSKKVREDDIINFVKKLKTPQEQVKFLSHKSAKSGSTPLEKLIELTDADSEKQAQYEYLKQHIQSIESRQSSTGLVTFTLFEKILNKIIPDRFQNKKILEKRDAKKAADIFREKFQSTQAPSGRYTQTSGARQHVQTR